MAECIFKFMAEEAGAEDCFEVASAAVSTEETGNDIYPAAKTKLREHHIPYLHHEAHQITPDEYRYFDKIICADYDNLAWLPSLVHEKPNSPFGPEEKVSLMMQWAGETRDVSDPWYTRDFEAAYQDIYTACAAILHSYID
jgi:protein-tyrosine phosphatase